jgi:hypothetical protein
MTPKYPRPEPIPDRIPSITDWRKLPRTATIPVGDQKPRPGIKKRRPRQEKRCMIKTITRLSGISGMSGILKPVKRI